MALQFARFLLYIAAVAASLAVSVKSKPSQRQGVAPLICDSRSLAFPFILCVR